MLQFFVTKWWFRIIRTSKKSGFEGHWATRINFPSFWVLFCIFQHDNSKYPPILLDQSLLENLTCQI
jgi:hypothetical protein